MKKCILFMAALAAGTVFGTVTMTAGTATSRAATPRSLSGITYAVGNTYYAVADDNGSEGGLYKYTLTLSADGKSIVSGATSVTESDVVKLPDSYDLEAVAFDPASGNVWAADETRETIKEYDPNTGAVVSELEVPAIIRNYNVGNYGMESLTISGDGLTMWTANEEALTCDGSRASPTNATTVRLVKFVRETVRGKFKLVAMYPYTTEKLFHDTCDSARHGVSDLVALPDGSLLVLERDYSCWGVLPDDFAYSIFLVTPAAMANATEIKDVPSLKTATWTAVKKTKVVEDIDLKYVNYEGLCLGPRLVNGNVSLLLVSDSGDGYTSSKILPLVLSGLDIRTLDFTAPDSGDVPSVVGTNYRYLSGAEVSVTLSGEGLAPTAYTNNGARVASASWSTTSGKSGTGATATFTVTGDDTLSWTVASSVAQTPIVGSDTFEEYAIWTDSTAIAGWTDGGMVNEGTPTPPSVGYPMQRATHAKVLAVDGSISRDYASSAETRQQIDAMVKVVLPEEDAALPVAGYQCGVVMSASGKALVVYAAPDGSVTNAVASERTFKSGDWVRVTLAFDYTSEPTFSLRLDGAPCGTFPCVGGKRRVSGFDVRGNTALDDVIFTDGVPDFEIAADPSSTVPAGVKVPSAWFDRYGLAWNDTESDADGDKLINWKEYLAGTAPDDGESVFEMTGFKVEGNDVEVTFSGELPRPDLLRLKWCAALGGGETAVGGTVTAEGGVSVWRATVPDEARFFRAYIDAAK